MNSTVDEFGGLAGESMSIFGMGASNGLAFNAHQTWAFFRAGAQTLVESPFRCRNGANATMAHQRTLPPKSFGWYRMAALSYQALDEMDAMITNLSGARIGVFIGVAERFGDGASDSASGTKYEAAVAQWFSKRRISAPIERFASAHAAFGEVLLGAASALRHRSIDVAIVGGADSYYDPFAIEQLLDEERLFDLVDIHRIIPGEGAAFLMLGLDAFKSRAESRMRAQLRSVAVANEPAPLGSGRPTTAAGLTEVLQASTSVLRREAKLLDWILGDLNHEDYRVREFTAAYPRMLAPGGLDPGGSGFQPPANASFRTDFLPQYFGDMGASTMPTAAVVAIQAFLRGAPRATNCVVFGSSVTHAARASLCLERAPT